MASAPHQIEERPGGGGTHDVAVPFDEVTTVDGEDFRRAWAEVVWVGADLEGDLLPFREAARSVAAERGVLARWLVARDADLAEVLSSSEGEVECVMQWKVVVAERRQDRLLHHGQCGA